MGFAHPYGTALRAALDMVCLRHFGWSRANRITTSNTSGEVDDGSGSPAGLPRPFRPPPTFPVPPNGRNSAVETFHPQTRVRFLPLSCPPPPSATIVVGNVPISSLRIGIRRHSTPGRPGTGGLGECHGENPYQTVPQEKNRAVLYGFSPACAPDSHPPGHNPQS